MEFVTKYMKRRMPAQPNSTQKDGSSTSAPISSNRNTARTANTARCVTPPICCAEMLSCSVLRCISESFLPEMLAINKATAMTPMPPI